jgi:NAD(P)H-hydrate epimerase
MAGAVRLAAEAALRAGAGLVTVVTRPEHVMAIVAARPELMVVASENGSIPAPLLHRASCILIGPGLGTDKWAQALLSRVLETACPKVLDADALNLITQQDAAGQNWVLTPHPGEAARLLGETTSTIQQSRFTSAEMLQSLYGGVLVLKGAGTLVHSSNSVSVCPYGNPGLATAGSGDVLSGIIAAMLAQGFDLTTAAELAVVVHAKAADLAASGGERGLIASDLFDSMRSLINPYTRV